eukprot:scaffold25951_cov15-Tisochrysis_lutea.AAC.1
MPSHYTECQRITISGWHRHSELQEEEEVEEERCRPDPAAATCNGHDDASQPQAQQEQEHAGAAHDAGMLLAAAYEQPAGWCSSQQQQDQQPRGVTDDGGPVCALPGAGRGEVEVDGRILEWQSHVQSLCVDHAAGHGSRAEAVLEEGRAAEAACGGCVSGGSSVKGGDQGHGEGGDLSSKQ